MTRILVTGAGGSIGSELVRTLLNEPDVVVCGFDSSEDALFNLESSISTFTNKSNFRPMLGDIRDLHRLEVALSGVDYVYHLAANKHVSLSEQNPTEAIGTNVIGTQNIINASLSNNVKKVLLTSSDKAVNPSSTMGASKLLSERLFTTANTYYSSANTAFSVLRFGNVWDTNGSVARIFNQQGLSEKPITLTSVDMTRFFLTQSAAVSFCISSMHKMIGSEIFVKSMGATSIESIANYFANHYNVQVSCIGQKPGEKLYEELFTDIELIRAKQLDDTVVILPDLPASNLNLRNSLDLTYGHLPPAGHIFRSDHPDVATIDVAKYCSYILK